MTRPTLPLRLAAVLALGASVTASASTYRVLNTNDSGPGSLRKAMSLANSHALADRVTFDASLAGSTIYPQTPLPALSDGGTRIDGDLDNNGAPDITINGRNLAADQDGLTFVAHPSKLGCTVEGLVIVNCPRHGIFLNASNNNCIRSCHLGVNRGGGTAVLNGSRDIYAQDSSGNLIGGDQLAQRNIIAGGNPTQGGSGVDLLNCTDTRIEGNYFGLNRSGAAALASRGGIGVSVHYGSGNTIGGADAKYRNLFGTSLCGVSLYLTTHDNVVAGDYFGLARDGDTLIPMAQFGVTVQNSAGNTIGGTAAGARNVFAGGSSATGVWLNGVGTKGNVVAGNYFGLNATGSEDRDARVGVGCVAGAGPNTIGGAADGARNYFCGDVGVQLDGCAAGTVIRSNSFGYTPHRTGAQDLATGVQVTNAMASVVDNLFAYGVAGLALSDGANPKVTGNAFWACTHGVYLAGTARANLGNLGNTSTTDDGLNYFQNDNTWFITNLTTNAIKAEGNWFTISSRSQINAKIYDHLDNAAYGRVDFDPLIGGVHPTGDTEAALALTATSAVPLASGAEIAFTLSAPAEVTLEVLNVAGRPVATPVMSRACVAGLQRLTWNGQSAQGLHAPSGVYLVRLTARAADGAQATALTRLRLDR